MNVRTNKETALFVFSCACGAFVGSLVALNIQFLWQINLLAGIFVGALVGRVCYHPIALAEDILTGLDQILKDLAHLDFARWRRNNDIRSWACWSILFISWVLPWIIVPIFCSGWFSPVFHAKITDKVATIDEILMVWLILAPLFGMVFVCLRTPNNTDGSFEAQLKNLLRCNVVCGQLLLAVNLLIFFSATILLLLVLLHKKEGSLVMFASAIGVILGWFFGSSVIGAFSGALVGLIEFRLVGEKIYSFGRPLGKFACQLKYV